MKTIEERTTRAHEIAAIITDAGAQTMGGPSSRPAGAAWQKGEMVRVYVTDGRGYTGRQYGFLTIDADGDVVGANALTALIGQKAIAALDAAGVETFA